MTTVMFNEKIYTKFLVHIWFLRGVINQYQSIVVIDWYLILPIAKQTNKHENQN